MNPEDNRGLGPEMETSRRDEVIETHLFDEEAKEEKSLCRADVPDDRIDYFTGALSYLDDRLLGPVDYTVCEGCKERAVPFALNLAEDKEADGLPDEAEEYSWLAKKLLRETGRRLPGDWKTGRWSMCGRFLRSAPVSTHRGYPGTVG